MLRENHRDPPGQREAPVCWLFGYGYPVSVDANGDLDGVVNECYRKILETIKEG